MLIQFLTNFFDSLEVQEWKIDYACYLNEMKTVKKIETFWFPPLKELLC
jgi:hypothetical protein